MDLDNLLPDVGEYGTYQKRLLWFVLLPCVLPCGFHAYNQLFMAASPQHWCYVPELKHLDIKEAKQLSIPKSNNGKLSQCLMYDRNYTAIASFPNESVPLGKAVPCKYGWTFDHSEYKETIVTEWNLVCNKDFYPTGALVLLAIGGLIGNYIFGYIQDGLGRKPAFFIYLFIETVFGIGTAFMNSFWSWVLFRFGVGFTVPAILATPYVLSIELVGPEYRTTVTILINIAYSIALTLLACIVYLVRDWRLLALYTSVPFAFFFFYLRDMPESPRWLLARGSYAKAEKILNKMAKVNNKPIPPDWFSRKKGECDKIIHDVEDKKHYGVTDLFRTPNLRKKTLIITFIWFTNTSVYVGLSYYAPLLGGNEFLNFFLAGAVELPTYLILWPAMEHWGRRCALSSSMIFGGLSCVLTIFNQENEFGTWLGLVLYCCGKMGISCSYVVLPLFASELYPTVVRGLGMSTSAVVGMLGPIFIPLLNYMGGELPLLVMGVLLLLGGIATLFLPETHHLHLPQTIEDAENFGNSKSKTSTSTKWNSGSCSNQNDTVS
ncbi:unnamed protein product [Bemisia tabaci]|uniref:Major facilitator superfamily (MFS) profile domain-containing protein n=1 Tax=Bemisia tabaci TaxID=7038 RepID=A0A9P0F497_BEMTA|nr:unnamed protein product [Bemisia tabaci]